MRHRDYRDELRRRKIKRSPIQRTEKQPGELELVWDARAREHRWIPHGGEVAA